MLYPFLVGTSQKALLKSNDVRMFYTVAKCPIVIAGKPYLVNSIRRIDEISLADRIGELTKFMNRSADPTSWIVLGAKASTVELI